MDISHRYQVRTVRGDVSRNFLALNSCQRFRESNSEPAPNLSELGYSLRLGIFCQYYVVVQGGALVCIVCYVLVPYHIIECSSNTQLGGVNVCEHNWADT
jgi:hypothetical protein